MGGFCAAVAPANGITKRFERAQADSFRQLLRLRAVRSGRRRRRADGQIVTSIGLRRARRSSCGRSGAVVAGRTGAARMLRRRRGPMEDGVIAFLVTLCHKLWSKGQR